MQPHREHVVSEKRELDDKLSKLTAFLTSAMFAGLDGEEKGRLERQWSLMTALSGVLGERIAAFK